MQLPSIRFVGGALCATALVFGAAHEVRALAATTVGAASLSRTAAGVSASSTSTIALTPPTETATPLPSPSGTGLVASSTPNVPVPTQTVLPVNTNAVLSSRVVEDSNQDGVADDGDVLTSVAPMSLIPWSDPGKEIVLITGKDGAFSFTDLPSGDYTLRLFWPTGFAGDVTAEDLPHILRAVFRVTADGRIDVPTPFPETWPGLPLEKFDPAHDRTLMGPLPPVILVNYLEPGLSAILPGTGEGVPVYFETVDVAAALRGEPQPVRLPSTGSAARDAEHGSPWAWLVAIAVVLSLVSAVGFRAKRD